jgi:DNA-3-methyladenine glycosylase
MEESAEIGEPLIKTKSKPVIPSRAKARDFAQFSGTAKQAAEKVSFSINKQKKHTSVAKATADFIGFMPGINPRPTARMSFSAACKAVPFQNIDLFRDSIELAGRLLARGFFEASPEEVAPRLLGKVLAHRTGAGVLAGRIVEVEAYLGPHNQPPDPAAHAYRGATPRNRVLFGPAGHAYIYSIYGRYFCMNISCEAEGRAGCVLLRALEPLAGAEQMARNRVIPRSPNARDLHPTDEDLSVGTPYLGHPEQLPGRLLTSGPSRLCQALGITRAAHNECDLLDFHSRLQVRDDGYAVGIVLVTPRIGIHEAVDWPLRFALAGNNCVSGAKRFREGARRVE